MNEVISVKELSYHYPKRGIVLDEVNFSMQANERVALVGDNGAGKTTLLHLLLGLKKAKKGDITAFGKVRREEKDFVSLRAKIGLLFQDSDDQLFCPTVIEDVAFGPLNLGKSREEAMEISLQTLATLGMEKFADRVTYQLSGGEKRMIALASILSMQPELLFLDEPSNALDKRARRRLLDTLAELPQGMIIVSHDDSILNELANRWVKIDNAKLVPFTRHEVDI